MDKWDRLKADVQKLYDDFSSNKYQIDKWYSDIKAIAFRDVLIKIEIIEDVEKEMSNG